MRECPECNCMWPVDRYILKSVACFRCRVNSLQFNYGKRGKQDFHDITVKEFNDRQVREARANGLDPQPVMTKATAVPSSKQFAKLATALGNK